MFDTLIGLLAPHLCLACGATGALWCEACRNAAPLAAERCYKCHALSPGGRTCGKCCPSSPLYAVQAATRYEGYAKQLVWKLKFERAYAAAIPIADVLARRVAPTLERSIVSPAPTSTGRVRQRGYDQAVVIARRLSRITDCQYLPVLARLGQKQQRTASRTQRLTQLRGAFHVWSQESVKGLHIILVDDVVTTGATLEAAAVALKAAGAKRVSAVVFAQA